MLIDESRRILRVEKPMAAASVIKVYATGNLLPSSMYTIIDDPETTLNEKNKVIRFHQKWRSPDDYFEVDYLTLSEYCPKCNNGNYLDDISYTVKGDFYTIRNEKLLMQNVEKFTITELNSNPFHVFIGTSLVALIGTRITSVSLLVSQVTSEITRTLQKLQSLQSQYRMTGRSVTSGEILKTIDSIEVVQDEDDPTVMRADVSVIAESGKTVEFAQYLKIR
jgi:hypothetical protein